MKIFCTLLVYSLCVLIVSGDQSSHIRPSSVNVGALLSLNSTIGRVAKPAMDAAVEAVNSNQYILSGTRLNMMMMDTKCDTVVGMNEGLNLMQNEVVAVLGPQSSEIARLVSQAAEEVQVPVISFAATDPYLNSSQFPYFIQATHTDYSQMIAVADLVEYFEWRTVTIIYTDNEYGRSGMKALEDVLLLQSGKDSDIIFYRAPLIPNASTSEIDVFLFNLNSMESRVFIVHLYSVDIGFEFFSAAKRLGMMENGYAWITTDWLSTALDSSETVEFSTMEIIQGVLSLRRHIPDSMAKRNFDSTWNKTGSSGLNSYAYSAYDSVWVVAEAIHRFLNEQEEQKQLKFSTHGRFKNLKIFQGGSSLLQTVIARTNFTGLTGEIRFNSDRTLANAMFDVLNIEETASRIVGYWSKSFGLSLLSPDILDRKPPDDPTTKRSQQLHRVVWPGESLIKPKELAVTSTRRTLRIGVPYRVDFTNIVTIGNYGNSSAQGYCIDIFRKAISLVPDPPPYSFVVIGNGIENPNYDELLRMVANDSLDAVVGDIAIVSSRALLVDFTKPYMDSGLVIIAPFRKMNSNAWAFLRPFTGAMWSVTAVLFLFVGVVIWILEHRLNEDFRGPPRQQITTIIWFSLSTMCQSQRQTTVSTLGRIVMIIWFFVVLILNSSYVASLTSILTVQRMTSPVKGIESLINSSDPIGFQAGLGVDIYLHSSLNVSRSRLKPLKGSADYVKALELGPKQEGGVAAIIDQIPYARLFTARHCQFKIVDDRFKRGRWGFAFQKRSPLVKHISTAILDLVETGDLQRMNDKWQLSKNGCSADNESMTSNRQNLESFWGLFLMCGVACLVALLIFFARLLCQYRRYCNSRDVELESPPSSSHSISDKDGCKRGSIKNVIAFLDMKEELKSVRRGKSSPVSPLTDSSILQSNNNPTEEEEQLNRH